MKKELSDEKLQQARKRQLEFISRLRDIVGEREKEAGRPLTACVVTFGCQMNERDSEKLKGILKEAGFVLTDSEKSDLVIYNTCTVRENADLKVFGRLGRLGVLKKENEDMIIAICGCMAQEGNIVEKLKKSYPQVDIIFGTFNVYKLAELLCAHMVSGERIIDIWEEREEFVELLPSERKYSFKSGVNIMYGCDNFCTYCIVPYVRGREISRRPEDIEAEVRQLAASGVVEVCLLGQNVNSYGKGLDCEESFPDLLRRIEKIEGIKRIRFMTPHPKDLSDDLIDAVAESDKICKHIHLPLQSGSSRVLKKMNRSYTKESYLALAEKIREKIPGVAITTDIIVGFPGETEEDFMETLDVVKKVKFNSAFTFIYSKRSGTAAATFKQEAGADEIKLRFDRLLALLKEVGKDYAKDFEGQRCEVLIEGEDEQREGYVTGRLSNNMLVHFSGDKNRTGELADVKIEESKGFYFLGKEV